MNSYNRNSGDVGEKTRVLDESPEPVEDCNPLKKQRFELFDEPEYTEKPIPDNPQSSPEPLENDPKGFVAMLETNADPNIPWANQIEKLAIHDEFDFVDPDQRPLLFAEWAAKHAPSYLDLVTQHSRPGLFYAHFKRQYGNLPGFKEYPDPKRETIYRDYMRFSKKTAIERQELRETYREDALRTMVLDALE